MIFSWILINNLAIGTPIITEENKKLIEEKGIKSILDLRNNHDLLLVDHEKYVDNMSGLKYKNFQLPDHNSKRLAETYEIHQCLSILTDLLEEGPVFMHCHAGIERSPLISVAYLQMHKGLNPFQAYDFVKQNNKKTNVSIKQLNKISLTK